MSEISRRDLLRGAGSAAGLGLGVRLGLLGAVTGSAVAASQLRKAGAATPWSTPLPFPQVITDSEITLEAAEADVPILPGAATRMWTFRRPSGNPTTLTVRHLLPTSADTLTIHHHGSHSASVDDGLPAGVNPDSPVLKPGGERVYVYEHQEAGEPERAAMQWYHDHSHGRTSFNSLMGLGGLFILDDDVEAAMPLPRGAYEQPAGYVCLHLGAQRGGRHHLSRQRCLPTVPRGRAPSVSPPRAQRLRFPRLQPHPRRDRIG